MISEDWSIMRNLDFYDSSDEGYICFWSREQLQDLNKGFPWTVKGEGWYAIKRPYFYNCQLQISAADRQHKSVDGICAKVGNPSVLLTSMPDH